MIRVHSFDVFDTCLARRTSIPSGVFYDTALTVFTALGLPSTPAHREAFVAARMDAEKQARHRADREDITLGEIWQILADAMGWPHDPALMRCELEAEAASIVPIVSMRKQVQAARREGNRIVFLSDMYLPTDFVAQQLIHHGFAEKADGVYVSGDLGKTKGSGRLFQHMLERENVAVFTVRHTGDNYRTDCASPQRLGIRATLFQEGRMTSIETRLLETGSHSPEIVRIQGAMRAFRLSRETGDADINELVSQFVAPFVLGFTVWALQRAREEGIKRLYFVSRDCQLNFKVARELSAQFGGIECRYLYASRQSLLLPSTTTISAKTTPWMRTDVHAPVLKLLLAKIELRYADVEPFLRGLTGVQRENYVLSSEADWECFWAALNEPSIRPRLDVLIAKRREMARQYMQGEGLLDPVPWALVDFGWRLSCQKSLVDLLRIWGRKQPVLGYYLGLGRVRLGPAAADHAQALFYQKPDDFPASENLNGIFPYVPLLEHIVGCADHPSVNRYEKQDDGTVGPAYINSVDELTLKFCRRIHEGVLDFVKRNPSLVDDFKDPQVCRNVLSRVTIGFFKDPTPGQARAVGELPIALDQNGISALPLLRPLNLGTALLPLLPTRFKFFASLWKYRANCWPEGSLAISPRGIGLLARQIDRIAGVPAKVLGSLFRR